MPVSALGTPRADATRDGFPRITPPCGSGRRIRTYAPLRERTTRGPNEDVAHRRAAAGGLLSEAVRAGGQLQPEWVVVPDRGALVQPAVICRSLRMSFAPERTPRATEIPNNSAVPAPTSG